MLASEEGTLLTTNPDPRVLMQTSHQERTRNMGEAARPPSGEPLMKC